MDREEKIRLAITAGIGALILLILIIFIAAPSKKKDTAGTGTADAEVSTELSEEAVQATSKSADESASASDSASQSESKETEKKDTDEAGDLSSTGSSADLVTKAGETAKPAISGNSFYSPDSAVLKNVYKTVKYDSGKQMEELNSYWAAGNMDAVRDLVHLERFEAMSYALNGTDDFFYYGETDGDGNPDGTGLAVFVNDQYYYGHWSNGKREGDGTWISFYPAYSTYVVKEHMYTGKWSQDLPQGQGQEHFDYNAEYMNTADVYLQNVIGGFNEGRYNGEMYVITIDLNGNTTEWTGGCDNGFWEQVPYAAIDKTGKIPYLTERENSENHIYMTVSGAQNNGVKGIIPAGKVKK